MKGHVNELLPARVQPRFPSLLNVDDMADTAAAAPVAVPDPMMKTSAPSAAPTVPEPAQGQTTSDSAPTPGESNGQAATGAPNGTAQGGQKRREQRPRLPLPDPIPETPVKKYPEPSREELNKKVNAIDAKIQECFDKLKASKGFYDQRQKIRDDGKPKVDAARADYVAKNEACRALIEEKKLLSTRLREIKDADMAANAGRSSSNDGGSKENAALRGCKTVEDVTNRIKELEEMQMSSTISIAEEKKLIAQINFLELKGKGIIESKDRAFKEEKASKDARIAERKDLDDRRKALDAKIDVAKAAADAQRLVLDKLRSGQDEEIKKLQESTSDIDRDAEKVKIGELKKEIRTLRDEFQVECDKWYLNERIAYEQQKIAKRKRWEAQQAEREEKRLAWEKEMAEYPIADPYQPEKDMCTALILHLQTLMGTSPDTTGIIKAESKTSSLLPTAGTKPTLRKSDGEDGAGREIARPGSQAVGKSVLNETDSFKDDPYGCFATQKSGSKKNRRGRKSGATVANGSPAMNGATPIASTGDTTDEDAKLKPFGIDYLTYFTNLDIKAPTKRSELKGALDEVLKKKEYFDNDPPEKKVETEQATRSAKNDRSTSISKTKAPQTLPEGVAAFPGLGGTTADDGSTGPDVSAAGNDTSNRPSFSDIASGNAKAPEVPVAANEPALGATGNTTADSGVADANGVEGDATTEAPTANGTAHSEDVGQSASVGKDSAGVTSEETAPAVVSSGV